MSIEEQNLEQPAPGEPVSADADAAVSITDAEDATAAETIEPGGDATEPAGEQASSDAVVEQADSPPAPVPAGEHQNADQQASSGLAPRGLKLVVTLQPAGAVGYRALLALGANGCDPLLRSAEVRDLAGALDEVPGLAAEAEARWQTQPRYPAAPLKARSARPGRGKEAQPAPTPSTAGESTNEASESSEAPDATPHPAGSDQLSLFG